MNKQKRLPQYVDGLGYDDIKKIEGFSIPWQRNFLIKFYEQLQKHQLKKTDICNNVNSNTDIYKLLPDSYTLPENTLSQFTNFNSSDLRAVSVSNLIAVSNALGVSINYLLGIDSCETPENTIINNATGLNNEAIETIIINKELQKKLNFLLTSPKINDISKEIDKEFYMQYVSCDIFNAYSEPLLTRIETAYIKFISETFPLDRTLKRYMDYLFNEIPFESIKGNKSEPNKMRSFIKSNLTSDRVNLIQLQAKDKKAKSDKNIYSIFINDTAQCTYELFEHKYNKEARMNRISQAFLTIIDDYMFSRQQEMKSSIKLNISQYKK